MIILGISWHQNSTASLMIDGKIVSCSSEERFSGVKNDERYPINAINWILKTNQIKTSQINKVCFISNVWVPTYHLTRHYTKYSIPDYVREQTDVWYPRIFKKKKTSFISEFSNKLDIHQYPGPKFWKPIIKKYIKKNDYVQNRSLPKAGRKIRIDIVKKHLRIDEKKITFIDHSTGHANYAFFGSPNKNEDKLVLTLDAFGDYINYSAHTFKFKKNKYETKRISSGPNFIIGKLYRYITLLLGMKPNEHEYKVMGLAPYCKEEYYKDLLNVFRKFQKVSGVNFKNDKRPKDLYFSIKKLIDSKRFDAIAGALQKYTEELVEKWVFNCIKKTKIKNVCLAGGVAMNVKANLILSKLKSLNSIYVPASPDDSSQSMGACYAYYANYYNNSLNKVNKPVHLENAYLGYNVNLENSLEVLKKLNNKKYIIKKRNINVIAAELINSGKIVGRVVGNAEFGARALGNRSILANPKNNYIKKKINEKVKNRDFWMPFAASVLEKYSKKYFNIDYTDGYNFMTNCLETTKLGKRLLKAALHPYDETCRPQILKRGTNPDYEDLINKFGKKSGVYALLNTSFNIHGQPISNNIKDAIKVFVKTDLDALILPGCIVIKK